MPFTKHLAGIRELELSSRKLEPTVAEYATWMAQTQEEALKFLENLTTSQSCHPQFTKDSFQDWLKGFHSTLQASLGDGVDQAESFSDHLKTLFKILVSAGIDTASGRYFGFIPGGGVATGALADFVAALTNRFAGMFHASPGAVYLENEVIRTFIRWVEFPETAWGTLTSGGTLATLTALLAARETRPRSEWDRSVIYLSDQAHHSLLLSLKVAGFDLSRVRKIETQPNFSLDLDALKTQIAKDQKEGLSPWILIASFGTTNTGSVDDLSALAQIRDQHGLWLHVDAAYGGFFVLTETGKTLFRAGGTRADSIVLDPHKGLFMPYGTGAVLVRDGITLRNAFQFEAECLADLAQAPDKSPADYSPELTRPLRGARIYLSLKTFGLEPFRAALEEKLALTQYAYEQLQQIPELEFACPPQLTVIAFRVKGAPKLTENLLAGILKQGKIFLSSTRLGGVLYLRLCILSFRSHLAEVELAIDQIRVGLLNASS